MGRKALELHPDSAGVLCNLGKAIWNLHEDGCYEEAIEFLERSAEIESGKAVTWHALGLCHHFQGDLETTLECYDNALFLDTKNLTLKQDYALALMREGQWSEGLKRFEARWEFPAVVRHPVVNAMPEWKGEDPKGKTIVMVHEQGIGDSIQFVRYAQYLMGLGANVTIIVPPALVRLFSYRMPGVRVWNGESGGLPEGDYYSPTLSTFRWLGEMINRDATENGFEPDDKDLAFKDLISGKPYLSRQNVDSVMPMLDIAQDKFRIGIVWNGSIGPDNDRRRSAPLECFFKLAEIPGISLVSLQFGERDNDLNITGAETFIYRAMDGIRDFEDTARLALQLDLVVTVDTSVAHLCGALGIPTFVLTDYMSCWRWPRDSMKSEWYDSVTVFRKERPGTFDKAMERVCGAVRATVAQRKAQDNDLLTQTTCPLEMLAEDAVPSPYEDSHAEWRALNGREPEFLDPEAYKNESEWSKTRSAEVGITP